MAWGRGYILVNSLPTMFDARATYYSPLPTHTHTHSEKELFLVLGDLIPKLKSRQGKGGGAAGAESSGGQSGGGSKKKKGKRK